jgi:hypothetical protein
VRGCTLANTFGDVALAAGTYVQWATPDKIEETSGDNTRIGSHSMARSLLIATVQNAPYTDASAYIELLADLDRHNNPNHAAVHRAVVDVLGTVVTNEGSLPFPTTQKYLPVEAARDAAFVLDEHQILDNQWWIGYGIASGGVFTINGFLPRLHKKLASKEAAQELGGFVPSNALSYVKTYVAKLIDAYTYDSTRDRDFMGKVKTVVDDKRGGVDLAQLIAIGNGIAKGKNASAAPGEALFARYDERDMRNVGDALLLLLDRSRLPSTEATVQTAQFDQDMLHVEIVDMLHMGLRRPRSEALRRRLGGSR